MGSSFDVLVIGSGPGGEGAAMQAAKAGKSVVVVERYDRVGGGCTHWNTIPSKALRHAIQEITNYRHNPLFGKAANEPPPAFPDLARSAASVIDRQSNMRQGFYDRNGVQVLEGHARFVDEHKVEVERPEGPPEGISAEHFVIAVGSRPYHPPHLDFSHTRVCDSDTILRLDFSPRSMIIYGAGVVGCEYASMFRNLDVKIDLVNTRQRLMSYLDDEISDALAYHMHENGVHVRHNETCARVETFEDSVVLHLDSGKSMKADLLLWANGRTGNSQDLGLEHIGLATDERGNLKVNQSLQTDVPHIYAVGDIVGPPALASAAYDQGRFAARHIVDGHCEYLVQSVPIGIYTSPEISCIGRTERELTAEQVPYEVGYSQFKSLARAQITGQTSGMLKLLFHRKTLQILGVHCFGYQAAEILHIGQVVMAEKGSGNTLAIFINTTFNYPTMAEAYRVAALNGLNRLF